MRSYAATGVAVVAVVFGLLIARDCDAPDWQQGVMLLVLPFVAGAGVGIAVAASPSKRKGLGVGLASAIAAATAIGVLVLLAGLWIGECSR